MPKTSPLRQLRLRLLSLLDQKVGSERRILRSSIKALDRLIREKESEKDTAKGYHQECTAGREDPEKRLGTRPNTAPPSENTDRVG